MKKELDPKEILFGGLDPLHPEIPRLTKIWDGWNGQGITCFEVTELALSCPDWEIVRRIILAETVKWPDDPSLFLEGIARPFKETEKERVPWLKEITSEYPLGAIIGILEAVTWEIERHADLILWQKKEKLSKMKMLECMPQFFSWILAGTANTEHWIHEATDKILPNTKWSGDLANTFAAWRKTMAIYDPYSPRTYLVGSLMRTFKKFMKSYERKEFCEMDLGPFGSTILKHLSFTLFGELACQFQAWILWENFVEKHQDVIPLVDLLKTND